jgi:site-specific DNA-cytosine methylase
VGAAVPVPADGWRGAGVAAGPAGIAAWRTVDLQHFGWDGDTTPQRRRRVFVLGTRTGEYDPAEILLVADGLLGNLAASGEAGEGTAEDAPAGPHGPSLPTGFSTTGSVGYVHDIMPSLPHLTGLNCPGAQMMGVLAKDAVASIDGKGALAIDLYNQSISADGVTHTIRAMNTGEGIPHTLTYDARGNGEGVICNTLSGDHQNRVTDYTALVLRPQVQGVDKQQGIGFSDTSPTLKTDLAHQMGPVVSVSDDANGLTLRDINLVRMGRGLPPHSESEWTQAVILRNREGKPGGGKGPLVSAERETTLGTSNDQVVFTKTQYGAYDESPSVDATLGARDHASLNTDLALGVGIPRRLMPIECERLMGWPDHHTAHGTDEQGRDYALSDTARYKLCGNGVGSPVTAWIGMRLKVVLDKRNPSPHIPSTP